MIARILIFIFCVVLSCDLSIINAVASTHPGKAVKAPRHKHPQNRRLKQYYKKSVARPMEKKSAAPVAVAPPAEPDYKDDVNRLLEEKRVAPVVSEDALFRGSRSAPVTIVAYMDLQCVYCARGNDVIEKLRAQAPERFRVVLKHLPLDFHPMAMPVARYVSAVAKQNREAAWGMHDAILADQGRLAREGVAFLDNLVANAQIDMKKFASDLEGDSITKQIVEDQKEAASFGITGTPGFVVNDVIVRGAYPLGLFEALVSRLLPAQPTSPEKRS